MTFALAFVFRLMHILAAIMAGGGTLFMRLGLAPAAAKLNDEEHGRLREAVRDAWARWVHLSIAFLLISGLYNIAMLESKQQIPKDISGIYHALFGVKFLLAFGIFFIASMLAGKSEGARKFRQNARKWLTINASLIVVLVCISGALRVLRDQAVRPAVAAPTPAVTGPVIAPSGDAGK
jgi:uncharacterized membrane protein